MSISSVLMFFGFAGACTLAALTGSIFRPGEWYEKLSKPGWRPPNWLFAPVWSALYVAIAVSGWLIWRELSFAGAAIPLTAYLVQLILNASWTPTFFGLHRIGAGFVVIALLWISILVTISLFHPINAVAAYLLVPYLLWVTFAAALNFSIWRLNQPKPLPS